MQHRRWFFQSRNTKSATVVSLCVLVCFVCDSKFDNWHDVRKNIGGYLSSIAHSWFVTLVFRPMSESTSNVNKTVTFIAGQVLPESHVFVFT